MQKPLSVVCFFMVAFSDGYLSEHSSLPMKVLSSILGGSRYAMDPELMGRKVIVFQGCTVHILLLLTVSCSPFKIVEVTRNCDIKFCKTFWEMNENDFMHVSAAVLLHTCTL